MRACCRPGWSASGRSSKGLPSWWRGFSNVLELLSFSQRVVRVPGYISGALSTSWVSLLPSLAQSCGQELSVSLVWLLWGWSSGRSHVLLVAENKPDPKSLHLPALPLLSSCRLDTSCAEILCPNMLWFGFPVCWSLLHDKFMLNLPMTLNFVPSSLLPSPPTCPTLPSYLDSYIQFPSPIFHLLFGEV